MTHPIRFKTGLLFLLLIVCTLILSGCGDLAEIQDRDFVLAIGISYDDENYRITYCLPDLGTVTGQSHPTDKSTLLRTYSGKSIREIEQSYNLNSEKRLDYRHLQVIVLDSSVCSEPAAMKELLIQIDDYYDISHNVLVYFYESDVRALLDTKGINGSIGEHLNKMNKNNFVGGRKPAKIGTLIDCIENDRTLFIPALTNRENSIAVNGGIFFRDNQMQRPVSQPESDFYYIAGGIGRDYLIRTASDHLIRIGEVKTKASYELTDQGPGINLHITGSARILPGTGTAAPDSPLLMDETNNYIKDCIETELNDFMKRDNIDFLNLYEQSSYKSRRTWLRYQNRLSDFINDVRISVTVELSYQ